MTLSYRKLREKTINYLHRKEKILCKFQKRQKGSLAWYWSGN